MSANYQQIGDALAKGAQPEMLCATCPWDRNCIQPPSMTRAEVEAQMEKAKAEDAAAMEKAKASGEPALPMGSLLNALVIGNADRSATICPVFAVRLRSSLGRGLVDDIKQRMQSVRDDEVRA